MNIQTIRAGLALGLFALVSQAHSAELAVPRDGWSSWQVAAVEGAPDWCCWTSWGDRDGSPASCKLDDDSGNLGGRDHKTTDTARVYARLAGGKVERLRVVSATCPVEAATPIHDLGNVATDDSTRWFIALSAHNEPGRGDTFPENALAGLAMHRGDLAQNALIQIARAGGSTETRKAAVFWLALLRGTRGAEVVATVMFDDKDPELRQHAAFAITQSRSPNMTRHLIRQGNTDRDGEVRAQAWFWLAQTEAPEAEAEISTALRNDTDDHVREQAIFALSQLPDERATRALVAVAEDKSLPPEHRKRAVFWLAQSESAGAQKYLDKVLAGNATH
jgi:hypothetical protein